MSNHLYEYRRVDILELVHNQIRADGRAFTPKFVPGVTPVPVSGKVYDADELVAAVEAVLDGHWTDGPVTDEFERQLAKACGVRCAAFCNSGSSANLLALAALTSEELGERRLKPGDEVVTAACGFPTTVNPIVQLGMVPVFVDVDVELGTYLPIGSRVIQASETAKAMMFAHTLGNVFDAQNWGEQYLIEDCCDALGGVAPQVFNDRPTMIGHQGSLMTLSFYPAHQITSIEGGAVLTDSPQLDRLVRSFRDWGRDCWCPTGKDNTCGKRHEWKFSEDEPWRKWQGASLPDGYDHKYVYQHLGYNLKGDDIRAAIGLAQLKKLPQFVEARRRNWQQLRDGCADLEEFFILPEATPGSCPSWFGMALCIRESAPFDRRSLVTFLDGRKIATRPIFAGNLTRQPAFRNVKYRVVGDLRNSDLITCNAFWLGVWPGLCDAQLDYVIECLHEFCKKTRSPTS